MMIHCLPPARSQPEPAARARLTLLLRLRWLFVAACGALTGLGFLGAQLPLTGIALTGLGLLVLNLATRCALRRQLPAWLTPRGLFLQLLADMLALSVLVQQTGGLASPLVGAYLVPIALGANLLPPRGCWAMFVCAVASYSAQALLPNRVPHVHGVAAFELHQAGMWLTVVVAAALLAGFLARAAELLRRCERELADAREAMLHQEQLVALAALASNAAHELATPLATMSVTLEELARDAALPDALGGDVAQLGQQLVRCRAALETLAREAGVARGEGARRLPLSQWLAELADQWRIRQPQVRVEVDCDSARTVVAEQSLGHTLQWLLDHTASAATTTVALAARVEADTLQLAVRDCGTEVPEALRDAMRDPTQSHGELSHATIARLGGRLDARPFQGGTELVVTLPLAVLSP
ncbi:hypothetical protein [Niveibacterium sp.]|uniref:hypothetical protein n=1 Tax=Niveibacterium sp. TaxID=2017444 RepID=UPI0035ADC146